MATRIASVSDEPIVIERAAAPLSTRRPAAATGRRPSWRELGFGAAVVVLLAVAAWVFLALPDSIDTPQVAPGTASESAAPRAAPADVVPPYRAQQLEAARARAQERLKQFVELQLQLEQELHVSAWGERELTAAKDFAGAGDKLFLDFEYDAALAEYDAAVDALRDLVATGQALFDAALAEGESALLARDAERALAGFGRALEVRQNDARALAGRARAERLPEVLRLLREAERAVLREDTAAAMRLIEEARGLDPAMPGLAARRAELAAEHAQDERRRRLSDGYAALQAGDFDAADAVFAEQLRQNPGDTAALAGEQQVRQARTLAQIERLRVQAEKEIEAENWAAALASYRQALAIDSALAFARGGEAVVSARKALVDGMDAVIADPGALSADDAFAAARTLLEEASAEPEPGARFVDRLRRLREVVAAGAVPVPLVLTSDNATEVTILKVRAMGAFEQAELSLRPGRYVILGSRNGCRDVRKEIVLAADTAPVDIRCTEPI